MQKHRQGGRPSQIFRDRRSGARSGRWAQIIYYGRFQGGSNNDNVTEMRECSRFAFFGALLWSRKCIQEVAEEIYEILVMGCFVRGRVDQIFWIRRS